MSSSSGEEANKTVDTELLHIVNFVKKYPVILNKSQIPSVKAKKDESLDCLCEEIRQIYYRNIDTKRILKKINNLKTCVKKKDRFKPHRE